MVSSRIYVFDVGFLIGVNQIRYQHSHHEKRNALSETKSVAFFIIGLKRRLEAAVQCPVTPTMKKSDSALFLHCRTFLYVNCQMTFAHY